MTDDIDPEAAARVFGEATGQVAMAYLNAMQQLQLVLADNPRLAVDVCRAPTAQNVDAVVQALNEAFNPEGWDDEQGVHPAVAPANLRAMLQRAAVEANHSWDAVETYAPD